MLSMRSKIVTVRMIWCLGAVCKFLQLHVWWPDDFLGPFTWIKNVSTLFCLYTKHEMYLSFLLELHKQSHTPSFTYLYVHMPSWLHTFTKSSARNQRRNPCSQIKLQLSFRKNAEVQIQVQIKWCKVALTTLRIWNKDEVVFSDFKRFKAFKSTRRNHQRIPHFVVFKNLRECRHGAFI